MTKFLLVLATLTMILLFAGSVLLLFAEGKNSAYFVATAFILTIIHWIADLKIVLKNRPKKVYKSKK